MTISAREYLVDLALAAGGLSAAPATFDDYTDLLATSDADKTPERRRYLASASSCALTVRGLWFRAGVRHPRLLAPYRIGFAIGDLVEIAEEAKALRGLDYVIDRADALIIGEGNNLHALLVTAHAVEAGEIWSIDGGQHAGVFEAIAAKERHEVDQVRGRLLGGRGVPYVIDFGAIADRWAIGETPDTERIPVTA
jgi:hypothetical protein